MFRYVQRGAAALLILAAALGCAGGTRPTSPVSGTVTLDDKPLPEGTVYFKTVATGAIDALPVKDGRFEGRAEEGERGVEVTASRYRTVGTGQMKGEVQESLVASRYNVQSNLTATVTRGGQNTFDFAVKSR